jgi:hypothetical protein
MDESTTKGNNFQGGFSQESFFVQGRPSREESSLVLLSHNRGLRSDSPYGGVT